MQRHAQPIEAAISEVAWRNFYALKPQFDAFCEYSADVSTKSGGDRAPVTAVRKYGGAVFDIFPLREYWPRDIATSLKPSRARRRLHRRLREWARTATKTELMPRQLVFKSSGGELWQNQMSSDTEAIEAYWLITGLYWSLCSVIVYGQTIEELIAQAWRYKKTWTRTVRKAEAIVTLPARRTEEIGGVERLLALNRSFLMAEWMKDLVFKAVANEDDQFFAAVARGLKAKMPVQRIGRVKNWWPVVVLWYLGGEQIRPRGEFMRLLQQKDLLASSPSLGEDAFRAMLNQLGLTRP